MNLNDSKRTSLRLKRSLEPWPLRFRSSNRYAWSNVAKEHVIAYLREIDLPEPPNAAFDTVGLIRFLEKTDAIENITVAHAGLTGAQFPRRRQQRQRHPPHEMVPRYVGRSQIGINDEGTGNFLPSVILTFLVFER